MQWLLANSNNLENNIEKEYLEKYMPKDGEKLDGIDSELLEDAQQFIDGIHDTCTMIMRGEKNGKI